MTITIEIQQQHFTLHPTGAVFWVERRWLLISDVHLGKVSHFRKHGFAVPEDSIMKNFEQLDVALDYFEPERLIFLGDLFHSKLNSEWWLFESWVRTLHVEVLLIQGNHDIIAHRHYDAVHIRVLDELIAGDMLLTHHPEAREGLFNFCGHIHPAVRLRGTGRQSLKLPCFFQRGQQLILPAFGTFTGTFFLVPERHECVYAITKEAVIEVC